MKHTTDRSSSRAQPIGFTLIQLLVVVSIVALLVALLLPGAGVGEGAGAAGGVCVEPAPGLAAFERLAQ